MMNYQVGSLFDNRFVIRQFCASNGGMGKVLFVEDTTNWITGLLALKYCSEVSEDYLKRFKREVRLLESFRGNTKVCPVLFSNIDYDPPYFVMPYFNRGDLTNIIGELSGNYPMLEQVFIKMIDCISELHARNVYHRDIKPQNFLIDGENLIVSDFGLGMDMDSSSRFTNTSVFGGTQGYLPPEFQNGGFKDADQTGDIFMLGKSFYVLLTNSHPSYIMEQGIHPALYYVIDRACNLEKWKRYQKLSDLKQALQLAFDNILGRGGQVGTVNQLIRTIEERLHNENRCEGSQVLEFIERLTTLDISDQIKICLELSPKFFQILGQEPVIQNLHNFLKVYKTMIESGTYSWAYAEYIADNLKNIFISEQVPYKLKAEVLEMAIDAAYRMNRFAAMDTCVSMISSVRDEALATHVVAIMDRNPHYFILNIEPSQCNSNAITNYLASKKHTSN